MKEQLVTVNMTYARIALILLALNLLATGYTLSKMEQSTDTPEPVITQEDKTACAGCGEKGRFDLRFLRG